MDTLRRYTIKATGITPLLMHSDDIEWSDQMSNWKLDPKNKKSSVAGDDRSPAFRWLGCLWHDGTHIGIPTDAFGACLLGAGAKVLVPGGKNGKSFKAQSQSGMSVEEPLAPLSVKGKPLRLDTVAKLKDEALFDAHKALVEKLGFVLFLKRARIGAAKHVRVRPRFDEWGFAFTLQVWDDQITDQVVADIARIAGAVQGLGDWRPSSPQKPGPYGRFTVKVDRLA